VRGLFGRRPSPVGVEVDARFVRLAQVEGTGPRPRLRAAVRMPRIEPETPFGPAEARHLEGAMARLGLEGNRLVLAVPEEHLAVDLLELPPRDSGAPLEAIARSELARTHGYAPDAAETVLWGLPPSPRAKDVTQMMGLALPHDRAERLLEAFEVTRLAVVALDTTMAAVARLIRDRAPREGFTALLHLGYDAALLVLVYQETAVYRRLMPENGTHRLVQAIERRLGASPDAVDCLLAETRLVPEGREPSAGPVPAETLRTLIRKPLDASAEALKAAFTYARQMYPDGAPAAVLLTGPLAAVAGAEAYLAERLGLAVHTVTPAAVTDPLPETLEAARDPGLTVALGLALFQEGPSRAQPKPDAVVSA